MPQDKEQILSDNSLCFIIVIVLALIIALMGFNMWNTNFYFVDKINNAAEKYGSSNITCELCSIVPVKFKNGCGDILCLQYGYYDRRINISGDYDKFISNLTGD